MRAFLRRPRSGVMPMLIRDSVSGRGQKRQGEVGVEDDDGTEGGKRKIEVRRWRGGIRTGTNKKCDGVHRVHISDQMGRRQDRASKDRAG